MNPAITVVVPFFNEQENAEALYQRLCSALNKFESEFELVFVDDGSVDETPSILDALSVDDPRVRIVHLSRNFGHQAAITAGIDSAQGQAVVIMDGDGQDPPEVIEQFVLLWRNGYDVVYAIRTNRKEGVLKRFAYFTFYRILRLISELDIPLDSGDFCLMDRAVVDALRQLPERTRFVRGLRTFVGYRQVGLKYERAAREAGQPKYTLRKLVALAVDGLVSFSSYPLHLVTQLGVLTAFVSVLLVSWVIIDAFYNASTPRGWASTLVVVLFMGAIQLISLGIIGEYVRRIFLESKGRPTYIIKSIASREVITTPARAQRPLPLYEPIE